MLVIDCSGLWLQTVFWTQCCVVSRTVIQLLAFDFVTQCFELMWTPFESVIRPEVTQCVWQDVRSHEPSQYLWLDAFRFILCAWSRWGVTYGTVISSQLMIGRFQPYATVFLSCEHLKSQLALVFVRPALRVLSTWITQNICQWQRHR